jgi:DNA-binding GntR family transcriptional regulator
MDGEKLARGRDGRSRRTGSGRAARSPERVSQTQHAYDEMRRRILDTRMPAGTQYLEQELATLLGMSRTPVREALIRLAEDRLVEVRPRHGARVLPVSVDDMREIYEMLMPLEALAARKAAERNLAAADIAEIVDVHGKMVEALERSDLDTWAREDDRFHRTVVALSGNKRLIGAVGSFLDQAHRVRMLTLRKRPVPVASNRDHADLIAAIRARDGARAAAVHQEHRRKGGELLLKLLATAPPEGL